MIVNCTVGYKKPIKFQFVYSKEIEKLELYVEECEVKIYYKGFLCNLAPYRVMGEDRHALFPVTQSNDPIFYEEFDEVHYGLWAKVLTDEEYQEIVDTVTKNE